ncbi:MAG: signal peptidase I [Sumerlaeia bacterium]
MDNRTEDPQTQEKQTRKRPVGTVRFVASVVILGVVVGIWMLFIQGRLRAEEVLGPSMEPTLATGDRLIVSDYMDESPGRGDIVSLVSPGDGGGLVKRVVAVPGDFVIVADEYVFLNRIPSAKELQALGAWPAKYRLSRFDLEEGEFFVVGDNASNSYDSRFFGPVGEDKITGKVLLRYSPLDRAGKLDHLVARGVR